MPESVLLIHLEDLGDVVLTTPAIRAARAACPNARIDFLTGAAGAQALAGNPHLDSVIKWDRRFRHVQLIGSVAAKRYDTVIDFQSRGRSHQLVWACGAAVRVGIARRRVRDRAYTHLTADPELKWRYVGREKLELLRPIGYVPTGSLEETRMELFPSSECHAWADEIWRRHDLERSKRVVAISGVSRRAYKQWGTERWARVGDAMAAQGARVIVTHGPGEEDQADQITRSMRYPAVSDFDTSDVQQLAALLSRCSLWLGNDSGAGHIAAAMGVPTIAVHRWHNELIWSDTRPGSGQLAIQKQPLILCRRHCGRCAHHSCLREVTVDDVATPALVMLQSQSARDHAVVLGA